MFTEISMTNFKSWRETGPVRMAPLTAFFGANSSGKSSLLQMLLLLKQTAESNDRGLVLKTGSMQPGYVNLGTPQEITFRNETEMAFGFSWRLTDGRRLQIPVPGSADRLELSDIKFGTVIHADSENIYVKSLRYEHGNVFHAELKRSANNHYVIQVRVCGQEPPRPQGRPRVFMRPEKYYGFSSEAMLFYSNTDYLFDIEFDLEWSMRNLHYLGPLREYPQRTYSWSGEKPTDVGLKGELAIHSLLARGDQKVYKSGRGRYSKLKSRIGKWLVDLDLSTSFDLRQLGESSSLYQVWLKRHQESKETLLPDMGIGVSQVLPVLILCYYVPQGSTLIFEQPELHLHPAVQAGLADVFIDVIQKRNVQIIVESHSEHFLRRLQLRVAQEKLQPDETALFFCQMLGGESRLTPLEMDMFGDICNWPDDFFGNMTGDVIKTVKAGYERKLRQTRAS